MGLDLETGAIANYSRSWGYDEAEGVSPDGAHIAVEREPDTYRLTPRGHIEIWATALDGSGRSRRLTRFGDHAGFGASNPVVSPDGRWLAFQLRAAGRPHGNGQGIPLYDLARTPADVGGSATYR
jgi:Tol biopolymer transport system component